MAYTQSLIIPEQVLAARKAAGHTQAKAAAIIYSSAAAWKKWECEKGGNQRAMHPALFELYKIKTTHALCDQKSFQASSPPRRYNLTTSRHA